MSLEEKLDELVVKYQTLHVQYYAKKDEMDQVLDEIEEIVKKEFPLIQFNQSTIVLETEKGKRVEQLKSISSRKKNQIRDKLKRLEMRKERLERILKYPCVAADLSSCESSEDDE